MYVCILVFLYVCILIFLDVCKYVSAHAFVLSYFYNTFSDSISLNIYPPSQIHSIISIFCHSYISCYSTFPNRFIYFFPVLCTICVLILLGFFFSSFLFCIFFKIIFFIFCLFSLPVIQTSPLYLPHHTQIFLFLYWLIVFPSIL